MTVFRHIFDRFLTDLLNVWDQHSGRVPKGAGCCLSKQQYPFAQGSVLLTVVLVPKTNIKLAAPPPLLLARVPERPRVPALRSAAFARKFTFLLLLRGAA